MRRRWLWIAVIFMCLAPATACASATRAISAEATIRKRLTAFSTGLAPSRIRPYIMTVSGGSEPTSISVVLKFSNDIRKEMAAAPISAGFRYGIVTVHSTAARDAPRLYAASSSVASKRFRRAAIVSVAIDTIYENWPATTSGNPGRRKSRSSPP